MREPLQYTTEGSEGPNYFRVYECEHITDGSYPIANVIPIGSHTNLALCKHCWQHVYGMVAQEQVKEALRRMKMTDWDDVLKGEGLQDE